MLVIDKRSKVCIQNICLGVKEGICRFPGQKEGICGWCGKALPAVTGGEMEVHVCGNYED